MENLIKVNGKYKFNTNKLKKLSTIQHDGCECIVLGVSDNHIHLLDEYGIEFIDVEMYMTINKIAF